MTFNINNFRSKLINDGARPNLFEVELTFPPSLNIEGEGVAGLSRFMIKAAQLPGSTVGTVTVPYFGREIKFAGNRTFPDWTVTVINDENFKIKNAFERWLNYINGHQTNLRAPGRNISALDYFADMGIRQYSKSGDVIKYYKFVQAFPVDLAPIDVNWGDNDAIEEFSITFAYQYWLSGTTDQPVRADSISGDIRSQVTP